MGGAGHIAVDIAAGGDGIRVHFVEWLHRVGLVIRFQAVPVELDGLPGGDLDDAGGMFAGDMMGGDPLRLRV